MANQWKCAPTLIEAGADVNKANNHGDVSLMCAARKGDDEWLSKLVKVGADVNIVNKLGETAFTIASSKNHEKCLSILVQQGADVKTSVAPASYSGSKAKEPGDNQSNGQDASGTSA